MLIKEKRLEKNLSQAALAEKVQCSQGHISDIENGNETPSPALAKKLADVLEIDVLQILYPDESTH